MKLQYSRLAAVVAVLAAGGVQTAAVARHARKHDVASPAATATPAATAATPATAVTPTPAVLSVADAAPISVTVNGSKVEVPANTPIQLTLQQVLRGNKVHPGQVFPLTATHDVVLTTKEVVVTKGALATGHISNRDGAGNWGKSSDFQFDLDSVTAVDGSQIPLNYHYRRDVANKGLKKVLLFGAFSKGQDSRMGKGSLVNGFIGRPVPIAVPAPATTPAKPAEK